jgi:hypothetical protein
MLFSTIRVSPRWTQKSYKHFIWNFANLLNMLKYKILVATSIIIVVVIFFASVFYCCTQDKGRTIYDIMKELKLGMPRKDFLSVVEKFNKPYIVKSKSYEQFEKRPSSEKNGEEYILIWVTYLSAKSLILHVWFLDDKLYMAKIRGENGPYQIKDAPPDILPIGHNK